MYNIISSGDFKHHSLPLRCVAHTHMEFCSLIIFSFRPATRCAPRAFSHDIHTYTCILRECWLLLRGRLVCLCASARESVRAQFFPAAWALFSPCATFIIFQTRGLNCAEVKSESNQRAAETLSAVWNMCHGARKTRWHNR